MTEPMDNATAEQLRSFVERIERLEDEKSSLAADIRDVKSEARAMGFDAKTISVIVKMRKKTPHVLEEEEPLLTLYRMAAGV